MTPDGGTPREGHRSEDEPQGPIIRDKRRVDPVTGQVRDLGTGGTSPGATPGSVPPAGAGATDDLDGLDPFLTDSTALQDDLAGSAALSAELDQARTQAAERLEDLRRLQAEYVNYRRRVERDREVVRDTAVSSALAELLPVLDDIGRARDHGDLLGAFKVVGETVEQTVAKLGLVPFGEDGEPFDPTHHEALMHEYSDEVSEPTAVRVLMPGYRFGDRVIRPARVAVAEPTEALPE